ncbi:uncharacterized protein EV420DRAFT_1652614 [Desarmillaria tabescens]|uniref:DUF4218 domain-containing protein n=1 Tax=Armillaria tabescens TaxID=1929756 RepID=A0AA39J536_ARMTA|nr:uncharacterized protein EV420DRAFT_1652614 [Desarmillaria tabescens]KAK0436315.1 hypothetical protein EV420DRAFT_1652614 [Desarmillaria tabescens]
MGLRWSELLRLKYFDITRFVVVDAMHNLFLGLIKEHFEGVLGLRLDPKDSKKKKQKNTTILSLQKAIGWLEEPLQESLKTDNGWKTWHKQFNKLQGSVLIFLCSKLQCPIITRPQEEKRKRKVHWTNELLFWRQSQNESLNASMPISHHEQVFTKAEIQEIRKDISSMITPSWLTPVPKDLGEAAHGKLKADQWRVLGATYFPSTLIRLWTAGGCTDDPSQRRNEILKVTMSLVLAVIVASSRVSSEANVDRYLALIIGYMDGVHRLFPKYNFHPNHHMAVHIHEFLRFYGPVHSWWTFPFERVIGMLQRIPTNFKEGELEQTMSCSFNRSANIRALISKLGCPAAVRECQAAFGQLINPRVRNTFLTDMHTWHSAQIDADDDLLTVYTNPAEGSTPIPQELYNPLQDFLGYLPKKAKFFRNITMKGLTFSTAKQHLGNSCVLIKDRSTTTTAGMRWLDYRSVDLVNAVSFFTVMVDMCRLDARSVDLVATTTIHFHTHAKLHQHSDVTLNDSPSFYNHLHLSTWVHDGPEDKLRKLNHIFDSCSPKQYRSVDCDWWARSCTMVALTYPRLLLPYLFPLPLRLRHTFLSMNDHSSSRDSSSSPPSPDVNVLLVQADLAITISHKLLREAPLQCYASANLSIY